jgi:hypothetical protein
MDVLEVVRGLGRFVALFVIGETTQINNGEIGTA